MIEKISPLVSVVIPTYNRKTVIKKVIESVLSQSYKNIEIIVVDDGSTDGTYQYLKSLNLPIKIIMKDNGGVASARNVGIGASIGEYIAFLDSDDEWLTEKLNIQISYLEKNRDAALVYSDEYIESDGKRDKTTRFQKNPPKRKMKLPAFIDQVPIHISSVVLRRRVFEELGGFDERLQIHEDSELWNRMSEKYDLEFISKPLVIYHWNTNSEHLMADKTKFIENGKIYLKIYEQRRKKPLKIDEQKAIQESYKILEKLERVK